MKIPINAEFKQLVAKIGESCLINVNRGLVDRYSCKEIFVYTQSSGSEVAFCDNSGRDGVKNFLHNMEVIEREIGLPKLKYQLYNDWTVIIQSPFWLNNKKRLDMLTCIFKQSRLWGKIEKVDDLKRKPDLKRMSYFQNDNLIKLLRKIRVIESIFTKVCKKPFKLFTNHQKGYINGLLSFERAFSKEIEEL